MPPIETPEHDDEILNGRRQSDIVYHWAIKALAFFGGLTLPLIGVIYWQMSSQIKNNAEEIKNLRTDFTRYQIDRASILSADRMAKLENSMQSMSEDMNAIKVSLAYRGFPVDGFKDPQVPNNNNNRNSRGEQ